MKKVLVVILAMAVMSFSFGFKQAEAQAPPPVAGGEVLVVTEIIAVANGWSVKKQILGHDVYNDKNEKVGKVYDIIIAPDKAVSYAIIAAGGFLGIAKHDVAISVSQFKMQYGKIVLPWATKDAIKAMPMFEYAK
ncbi:MAG TPA: PRC-barrel domain-containing protein [Syntrophales bacterium]|nr:PRC-barrel domain-containing protein [Syntrophales bacterium]